MDELLKKRNWIIQTLNNLTINKLKFILGVYYLTQKI